MNPEKPRKNPSADTEEIILDELADSRVSLVTNDGKRVIKKMYIGTTETIQRDGFSAEVLKKYLEVYKQDCEYLHQQETDRPEIFKFSLSNGVSVIFHVIPQGDKLEKVGDAYAVIGQEFIEGNNLRDDLKQESVSELLYQAEPEIRKTLIELSYRINGLFPERSRSYTITEPNVKIKYQDGVFHMYITDLADSLTRSISQEVIWLKEV